MPSGKRAKQQRRVAPPAPVRGKGGAGLGARQASPRALAIAGGVILLVIVAVVLAVVLSGGTSNKGGDGNGDAKQIILPTGTPATGDSAWTDAPVDAPSVKTMFAGIPQNGFVLGDPNAPVTLVEYIDLQCPVCQSFETTELPELITKYVKLGKLKIEMKPWNILDAAHGSVDSYRGQEGVIAAAAQNKAFQFSEVLYNNQGLEGTNWMNDAVIANFAASVDGLDTNKWVTDANSSATASLIQQIDNYANNNPNFTGTPTLLLGKGTEAPKYYFTGLPSLTSLESAIKARLK